MTDTNLWLIGAGPMAQTYAAVLSAMGRDYAVIARGAASAEAFRKATGIEARQGGLTDALSALPAPTSAIIATGVESLAPLTLELLRSGTSSILVEKPAGMSSAEVREIAQVASSLGATVHVAYNRRFFASVIKAKEMIAADGGLQSISFEFTEMAERIGRLDKPPEVKARWLLANSTHVIDLAFHIAGKPLDWSAHHKGALPWHPSSAIFAGAGATVDGVLFNYGANWNGPGRWGLELITAKRRFGLRPMEKLTATTAPLDPPEEITLDLEYDLRFKPGLYRQVEAFLNQQGVALCDIHEHAEMMNIYEKIGGYGEA